MSLILAVLLLFSCVLVHEAGHWAFLTRYGVGVKEISLGLGQPLLSIGRFKIGIFPVGAAITPSDNYEQLAYRQKFLVAIAGPLASMLYTVILLAAAELDYANKGLVGLAGLNFYIAALNLIPVPPLDGYKALVAFLGMRGIEMTSQSSNVMSRIGNGLIYGLGFYILTVTFLKF